MKMINGLDCFKGRQVTAVSLRQENSLDKRQRGGELATD
jgi:hypothetical protein